MAKEPKAKPAKAKKKRATPREPKPEPVSRQSRVRATGRGGKGR